MQGFLFDVAPERVAKPEPAAGRFVSLLTRLDDEPLPEWEVRLIERANAAAELPAKREEQEWQRKRKGAK